MLDPHAGKLRRREENSLAKLRQLTSDDPQVRASAALYLGGLKSWRPGDLARAAGVEDAEPLFQNLRQSGELVEIAVSSGRTVSLHRQVMDEFGRRLEIVLEKLHAQHPLQAHIERAGLSGHFSYLHEDPGVSEAVFNAVLAALADADKIVLTDKEVALKGRGPQLSPQQQELLEQLVEIYFQSGYRPPTLPELKAKIARKQAALPELIRLAAAQGRLVTIALDLYLHADFERKMRETLAGAINAAEGLTASQIRELLGTTRKYAIPFCEYLDRIGFTKRQGDLRFLQGK